AASSESSHGAPTRCGVPSPPSRQSSRPGPCACSAPSAREQPNLVERHTQPDVEHVLPPAGEHRAGATEVHVAHVAPRVVDYRSERDIAPEAEIISGAGRPSPSRAVPRGRGIDVIAGEPEPAGDEEAAAPPGVEVE